MKTNVKKIAVIGMLLAIQVVIGRYASISLPIVKLGFAFLPLSVTAILCGPLWGGVAGVMGDFLIACLGPYGYFPPMATTAFLSGCLYGVFLHHRPLTTPRVIACVVAESLLCSILLQTFWLTLLTGKAYLILLPTRLIQNAITAPVQVLCIRAVAPSVVGLVEQGRLSAARAASK